MQWQVAMRPGKRRLLDREGEEWLEEKRKASVRAKVEHPFQIVKVRFGYAKVRYRGLFKNTQRLAWWGWPTWFERSANLLRNNGAVCPESRRRAPNGTRRAAREPDQAAFLTIKRLNTPEEPDRPHFAASSERP